ncbi:flagellar export chaperone FlgN [Microbacterium sp. GXF7504]
MGPNELSVQLWRERELLELLLFKLEEQELLLAAGRSRWIHHASREIEEVLSRLQGTGVSRVVAAAAVAEEWGLDETATLRELIDGAPEGPWREIFAEHFRALTQVTSEIAHLRDTSEQQLRTVLRATQETIAGLGIDTGEYTTRGGKASDDSARIIDTSM